MHGFSRDNTWGLQLNSSTNISIDGTETVDGVTEGVDNSSKEALTDGNIDDRSGSLDDIAFLDLSVQKRNPLSFHLM